MNYAQLRYRQLLQEPDSLEPYVSSDFAYPLTLMRPESLGRLKRIVARAVKDAGLLRFRGFGFVVAFDEKDGVLQVDFWRGSPQMHRCSVEVGLAALAAGVVPRREPDAVVRVMRPETVEGFPVLESRMGTDTFDAWGRVERAYAPLPVLEVFIRLAMGISWTWLIESDPDG